MISPQRTCGIGVWIANLIKCLDCSASYSRTVEYDLASRNLPISSFKLSRCSFPRASLCRASLRTDLFMLSAMMATHLRLRSTTTYRGPENIGVVPIVESERELRKVERQIFLAHVVVRSDDSALEQRPERFDVVRVNDAVNVLALPVANRLMRESLPAIQILAAGGLISRDQLNF